MAERFGEYELLERLGAGGMGEVFLARRDGAAAPVVVKRLLPHVAAAPGALERFLQEAQVVARLAHPGIVRTVDLGQVQGRWFLAMEWVAGHDVHALTERLGRPLARAAALRVVLQAADALLAVHEARDASGRRLGVVHRDVTPRNLLVTFEGAVKLIDFGVASLGGRGAVGGTLGYVAPEVLLEGAADARGDQYALGVVAWELLAGRPAFPQASEVERVQAITEEGVPRLPGGDAAREAVATMTALDPARRFPSLREAKEALGFSPGPEALVGEVRAAFPQGPRRLSWAELPTVRAVAVVEATPAEAAALAQLLALGPDFSLEEAEAAGLTELAGQPEVLDLVEALVGRGLLRADEVRGVLRFCVLR